MAKTIFLMCYELNNITCEVFERSFHVEDCALARKKTDAEGPYRPVIYDYKARKAFAIVDHELTDESWELLKRLFTE